MKKILALVMAIAMMLSCVAFAEPTAIEFGTENTLVYDRTVAKDADGNPTGNAHVTAWQGKWVLVAAYIAEDGIDEYDLDAEEGFYAVPENAVFLELEALLNASANDPATGPIVDQANYWHAHTHDMEGILTLPEDIDEDGYKLKNTWQEWSSVVRGEQDGDFNFGPAKVNIKGEDDYIYWNDLTGFDFEEIEEFKYIGMNMDGQIVIAACDKNIATNEKATILFALVFDKVVEEAAE